MRFLCICFCSGKTGGTVVRSTDFFGGSKVVFSCHFVYFSEPLPFLINFKKYCFLQFQLVPTNFLEFVFKISDGLAHLFCIKSFSISYKTKLFFEHLMLCLVFYSFRHGIPFELWHFLLGMSIAYADPRSLEQESLADLILEHFSRDMREDFSTSHN